jgi:squalene cyclase
MLLITRVAISHAAILDNATTFLTTHQQADGSWDSTAVRRTHATVEALRALQGITTSASVRATAVSFLESVVIEDTDDRARRIKGLAGEGRSVASLVTQLLADKSSQGGWGLTPEFLADPLDTALGLAALAAQAGISDTVLRPIIAALVAMQNADGGWPCTDGGDKSSQIFCTSEALLALSIYRNDYFLTPQINSAVAFLRGQWRPDGSFGTPGPDQIIGTALASLAMFSVSAFDNEVAAIIAFLSARQLADGSWDGDPYTTALALRAFRSLTSGPYCGDGIVNRTAEVCDGSIPAELTCAAVGKGTGTLACTSLCTLNTSGCSIPPTCGDNIRNQSFEVCDGTDLAGRTCQSLGFATGNLACASDC